LVVKSEETLHAEVAAAENFFIQVGAKFLKIFQAIGHGSSGNLFGGRETTAERYYE
jgi:hypothetical protein